METQTIEEMKFLSTDLRGYEKYLKNEGYRDEYIGFLKLAPRLLFDLYGSRASIKFLKDQNFRSNFLDIIKSRYQAGTLKKYSSGIGRYREYLISEGQLQVCPKQELYTDCSIKKTHKFYNENSTPYFKKIEASFGEFLTVEMGYCNDEIRKKMGAFKKFISYLIDNKIHHLGSINGECVLQYGSSKTIYKTDWCYLKCFLTYAFREGHINQNFSNVIISKKKNRTTEKKYIENKKKEVLLSAVDCSNVLGKRNYAMFLLMARLALRPCETHRVKYKDVNWVKPEIFVRGKDGNNHWLPLPNEVALAIFDYLKSSERGQSNYIFVRIRPPYLPLKTTASLMEDLKNAYSTTGIALQTKKFRLNVFRHSWATDTLNSEGDNLYKVQTVLRHKSSRMTLKYAKYHSKKLSLFEVEWPEIER